MNPSLLKLEGVRKSFGRTEIIRGADLEVRTRERHALIGPNGAGKSTLFHLISGQLRVDSGQIDFDGHTLTHLPPQHIARLGIARSFQINSLFNSLSVFENLRLACLRSQGMHGHWLWCLAQRAPRVNDKTEQLLDKLGLSSVAKSLVGTLSYAEQRLLEVGMAVAAEAKLILLDEPTAGMSQHETENLLHRVRELTEGRSLLVIEHDMQVVFQLADRISVLVYGQVIATGSPTQVRADPKVQEAYLGVAGVQHA